VFRVEDRRGPAQVDCDEDLLGPRAQDNDDLVKARRAQLGHHDVEEGSPVDQQQLLGLPHPLRTAGGKHQPG